MGMFMDDASHATDFIHWILGRPISVMAEIDNVLTDVAPDDSGIAIYRFEEGTMSVLINTSVTLAGENTTEIYGDQGVVIQNYGDGPSTSLPRPGNAIAVRIWESQFQIRMVKELLEFHVRLLIVLKMIVILWSPARMDAWLLR